MSQAPLWSTVGATRITEGGMRVEMCSGSEAGSYLRTIDFCTTQL